MRNTLPLRAALTNSAKRAFLQASILPLLFLSGESVARGDLIATEPVSDFGTFSQLNPGVTGTDKLRENSCVPTSVANGLEFLNNFNGGIPGLMLPGYGTVNALSADMGTTEAGTSYPDMASGTVAYISSQGVASSVSRVGGESRPFVITLYDWLLADYAVQVWIKWDGGGAQCVEL